MQIYRLTIEDMTTLGAMGTSPTVKSRNLYSTPEKACAAAEEDYGKDIHWHIERSASRKLKSNGFSRLSSGDLRYVMYTVSAAEVE